MNKVLNLNKSYSYVAVIPALLFYTVFAILPLIISFVLSFTDWNMDRLFTPTFAGFKNYIELLSQPVFLRSIANTLLFSVSTAILKTLGGLVLALILVRKVFGQKLIRALFYMPCVISITVVGVLFKSILARQGLLNNGLNQIGLSFISNDWLAKYDTAMLSVIFTEAWMWIGFNMFIFISGLQAIPQDYYESSAIEGASKIKQFFSITVPLLMSSFTVVITLSIAGGLKVFDIIYVLTNGGPGFDTQVLVTYTYQSFSLGFLGESSAASILLALLVTIISFYTNKVFRSREEEL